MFHLPPPKKHPKFATLLFERGVDYREAADALGSSRETIRLICLPFDDPRRRVPNARLMARIRAWTDYQIRPADFYEAEQLMEAAA